MLPAQYVLMCYITKIPIEPARKRAILQQFQATQFDSGLWGLHEQSEPYLFITTLVYVAARILGVKSDDSSLTNARDFIQQQSGVIPIPSWADFGWQCSIFMTGEGLTRSCPKFGCYPSGYLPILLITTVTRG